MKKKGVGIAAGYHPTGMTGGGDPSQAYIRIKSDGSADLLVGACDIGQGAKTVLAQIAAEELGIAYEQVNVINNDSDICPSSLATVANRVTYTDGNAVVRAAQEARQILFEVAANALETSAESLEAADGKIFLKSDPECCIPIAKVARDANAHMMVAGRGHYVSGDYADPKDGMDRFATIAWGAILAEIEVDTETGELDVLKLIAVYDVGKAINPMLVEGQIEGGTVMGLGGAVMENLFPYYPSTDWQPKTFSNYIIPTGADIPEIETEILECPSEKGPFGAKGMGEMPINLPGPAIVNAIHNAVGVWIDELPVTSEKLLRALDRKDGKDFNSEQKPTL